MRFGILQSAAWKLCRRFGGTCGIKLRLPITRRHTPKESNRHGHRYENVSSDTTGCLSGQMFEYVQGWSKMRAEVSRGGSTVTSAQVNADRCAGTSWTCSPAVWRNSASPSPWFNTRKGSLCRKFAIRKASVEMGRAFSTYVGEERCNAGFWWGNLRERDPLEDPDADGRIILKIDFWEVGWGRRLVRSGSGQGKVAGSCECGN